MTTYVFWWYLHCTGICLLLLPTYTYLLDPPTLVQTYICSNRTEKQGLFGRRWTIPYARPCVDLCVRACVLTYSSLLVIQPLVAWEIWWNLMVCLSAILSVFLLCLPFCLSSCLSAILSVCLSVQLVSLLFSRRMCVYTYVRERGCVCVWSCFRTCWF